MKDTTRTVGDGNEYLSKPLLEAGPTPIRDDPVGLHGLPQRHAAGVAIPLLIADIPQQLQSVHGIGTVWNGFWETTTSTSNIIRGQLTLISSSTK